MYIKFAFVETIITRPSSVYYSSFVYFRLPLLIDASSNLSQVLFSLFFYSTVSIFVFTFLLSLYHTLCLSRYQLPTNKACKASGLIFPCVTASYAFLFVVPPTIIDVTRPFGMPTFKVLARG